MVARRSTRAGVFKLQAIGAGMLRGLYGEYDLGRVGFDEVRVWYDGEQR
jgi:hypothetical protein